MITLSTNTLTPGEIEARQQAAYVDRLRRYLLVGDYPGIADELAAALQDADIRIYDETGKEVAS